MIEEHTLSVLDFFKVVKHLKTYSRFAEGAESIDLIRPATDYGQAKSSLVKTAETIKALSMASDLWQRELPPMGAILKRLGKPNGILTAKEVAVFLVFFPVVDKLRRLFGSRRDDYPLWSQRFETVIDFSRLVKEVENLVDIQGRIKDTASVKLARIRRQLVSTQSRIKDALNGYLQSSRLTEVIAERIITQRNGRYVIPAVKGKENALRGIVQDTSKSGATVFVEPERVFPLNNQLISLAGEEEEEISFLLIRISDLLRHEVSELKQAVSVLAEFDSFYARARLAEALTAVAPVLNQRGLIDIREGRHPILILSKGNEAVVPQSIRIGDGYHTLVITGPNTGGKTVALKTVGLLTLMALCGMYIPVKENSSIAFYNKIYADIGDEQSLEQSLSTFSAHMTNVVHMLKGAQNDALYLLDELGAGTDPTEGAALAVSIIGTLHKKRATTIVATHFRLLKNVAANSPDMENASVEFNEKDLLPTYRLRMGFLGSSRAIVTAKRLGLPDEIVAGAEALVTGPEFKLDQLLVKLENETREQAVKVRELSDKEREINRLYQEW